MIYRRQRKQYFFAGFLAILAVVNVLFFFILNRPARAEYASLQASIKQMDKQIEESKKSLTRLRNMSTGLQQFGQQKRDLLMKHMLQRGMGYSEIFEKLDSIVRKAGVKYTQKTYTISPTPQAGLYAVSIVLPVEGSYSNVVNFIREIESSDTLFLINAIGLENSTRSSGQQGPGPGPGGGIAAASASNGLALSLTLETYFYQ